MEIMRVGFDNEKYLKMQSAHIMERIEKFGDKLTDRRTDEKYSYWKEAISDFDKKLEGAGVAGRA